MAKRSFEYSNSDGVLSLAIIAVLVLSQRNSLTDFLGAIQPVLLGTMAFLSGEQITKQLIKWMKKGK